MISVIVPVYKVESYLRQCLDSIVCQTYRDLEILLIDDASPDDCGRICDEYAEKDNRIRVFHFKNNKGLSAARNKGLDEATGEFIGFVDSDDWIEPNMYEVLTNEITEVDLVACGYTWELPDEDNDSYIMDVLTCKSSHESLIALINGKVKNFVWNKLYRFAVFEGIRFPEGKNFEDIATMHLILSNSKAVKLIPFLGYHCRRRKESITQTLSVTNLIDCAEANISRFLFYKNANPDMFQECIIQLETECIRSISAVWMNWYRFTLTEKNQNIVRVKKIKNFTREYLSPFLRSICLKNRILILFLRNTNDVSFAILYYLFRIYHVMFLSF